MSAYILLGRILFSFIFIIASFGHFSQDTINFAADHGVPMAGFLVPLSGAVALLGGLSTLFGYKAKWGGMLLTMFLIPVTLMMHNFWTLSDPAEYDLQRVMFLKNMSMLGGAVMITYFGAGALSVDAWLHAKGKSTDASRRSSTMKPASV